MVMSKKSPSTVRIPTPDKAREPAMRRQRQQLMRERLRAVGMGRGYFPCILVVSQKSG
jgi:hypothetical protein